MTNLSLFYNRVIDQEKVQILRHCGKILSILHCFSVAYAEPRSTINIEARKLASDVFSDGLVKNDWVINVSNKGVEISDVHLKSIFEKFYREDGSRSSESGRSGLGLAIAKEIIDAHGGSISAKSESGITTFTIVIPE